MTRTLDTKPPEGAPLPPAGEPDKINGTATVVVGCKLPNGMFCELGKRGDPDYRTVRLNGTNGNAIVGINGQPVVGGFGLTRVSKDFWEAWRERNNHLEFVRKGHVFVHRDEASARDHATDMAELRNGLEPLDPNFVVKGPNGEKLLEVDQAHLAQGRQDMAQARQAARR